ILENTFRHFKNGEDRKTAASIGASEVGGAVIASTTTSLCVFVPLLFIKGIAGLIIGDLSYTILYALGGSLIVAIFVVPYLASHILTEEHLKEHIPVIRGITKAIGKGIDGLEHLYRRVLRSAIENKAFVIILALSVLVMSVFSLNLLGFSFTQPTDMNEFTINLEAPPGFTIKETRGKVTQVEAILKEKVPELDTTLFYIGQSGTLGIGSAPSRAYGRIRLVERRNRDRDIFTIINLLREEFPSRIPDVDITVVNGGIDTYVAIATGGQGFTLELTGNNLDDVIAASSAVKDLMSQDPNVAKAEMNVSFNQQELVSSYSLDYMGNLGITPYEAAVTSRIIFNGMEAGTYRDEAGTYDIFLNSDVAGEKITDDVLNRISVRSRSGKFISFANFSTMKLEPALSTINHKNKMKTIEVTGFLREANMRETSDRITAKLGSLSLPIGVEWEVAGSAAAMLASFKSLVIAMLVAAFLVYMVMVIQFERFAQPLIVMAAIPFTLIGIVGGLLAFGSTLSIIAFMGVIALFGIVVNNAIVLIDYTNLLRKEKGYDLLQAVIQGGSTRLKPILMTTLTTVLGIVPMALSRREGAELYAPLGQAIAGGLITSTLITLFLVPVLYYMLESSLERRKREREEKRSSGVKI
ncbi:MAG: efflux RND transporter permease subunit, partial [Spirochaetales bacterium]